jgi:YVTN family beta-propeller protein
VIDAVRYTEIGRILVGQRPWGIALSPDGGWLYTANGRANTVSVIATGTRTVAHTVPVGERPYDLLYIP